MVFSHFYHPNAPNDQCTLFCDRNLINQRNIAVDVSKNVNATKSFVLLETDVRIVAAGMNELGIEDISQEPSSDIIPPNLKAASKDDKRQFLKSLAGKVVNKYILSSEKITLLLDKVYAAESEEIKKKKSDCSTRFKCRFPGCGKTYRHDGKRKSDHEASHGLPPVPVSHYANNHKRIMKRDDMFY